MLKIKLERLTEDGRTEEWLEIEWISREMVRWTEKR